MNRSRRGSILILTAILLVVLLAMVAFAVDVGYMSVVSNEMRNSVDAAAMAGAGALPEGTAAAEQEALEFLGRNMVGTKTLDDTNATVEFGHWIAAGRQFVPINVSPSAVRVSATSNGHSLFFGRVLGRDAFTTTTKAVAIYRPRDIMLVLDYSGSMNSHHAIDDLKEAVALFFDALKVSGSKDRVGLAIYSTKADLKIGLSLDYSVISELAQKEKADGWTNIGDGMMVARQELETNGRPGAQKMMVVMTDGHVNRPADKDPRQWVITQAELCRDSGIELVTISFGADSDKDLMTLVAKTSPGYHFLVEGSIQEQEVEIRQVFQRIATYRTTVLVQ